MAKTQATLGMRDWLAQLRQLDINDLGVWPWPAKGIVLAAAFCVTLLAGHLLYLAGKQAALSTRIASESELKREYERKAGPAAGIEALRARHDALDTEFNALLSELPKDTEVPGLIEDISRAALANGLTIEVIDLEAERATGFYTELPIRIAVRGGYHAVGAFASDVANLPRIVTLHEFEIAPEVVSDASGAAHCEGVVPETGHCYDSALRMAILAKTYGYLSRHAAGQPRART